MQIRSAQKLAWENKVAKGFNTTDVPLEFCLLQGEIAEAFDAWHKGCEDVGEELAVPDLRRCAVARISRATAPVGASAVPGLVPRCSPLRPSRRIATWSRR